MDFKTFKHLHGFFPDQIKSVKCYDVCLNDYPDFVDAYISEAYTLDGLPLTDEQLDTINEYFREVVDKFVFESIY